MADQHSVATCRNVLARVLELQSLKHHLLFTAEEIIAAAETFSGSSCVEIEHAAENIIARHKNVLRFTSEGIKRAKAAYGESPPAWWQVDQDIAADIAATRRRLKERRLKELNNG